MPQATGDQSHTSCLSVDAFDDIDDDDDDDDDTAGGVSDDVVLAEKFDFSPKENPPPALLLPPPPLLFPPNENALLEAAVVAGVDVGAVEPNDGASARSNEKPPPLADDADDGPNENPPLGDATVVDDDVDPNEKPVTGDDGPKENPPLGCSATLADRGTVVPDEVPPNEKPPLGDATVVDDDVEPNEKPAGDDGPKENPPLGCAAAALPVDEALEPKAASSEMTLNEEPPLAADDAEISANETAALVDCALAPVCCDVGPNEKLRSTSCARADIVPAETDEASVAASMVAGAEDDVAVVDEDDDDDDDDEDDDDDASVATLADDADDDGATSACVVGDDVDVASVVDDDDAGAVADDADSAVALAVDVDAAKLEDADELDVVDDEGSEKLTFNAKPFFGDEATDELGELVLLVLFASPGLPFDGEPPPNENVGIAPAFASRNENKPDFASAAGLSFLFVSSSVLSVFSSSSSSSSSSCIG